MGQRETFARFVAETDFGTLAEPVLQAGKRSILDCLATALGGTHSRAGNLAVELFAASTTQPKATLLGRNLRTSLRDAVLVNATSAHALDFDDTLSVPAAMVGLAVAEDSRLSGRELLTSYILGFEISRRVASGIGGWENARGWHMMGAAGGYGAAIAAAYLWRLNADQIAQALGMAATQASGLVAMHGYLMKPFHAGKAAADGLLAAQLAQRGCTSGPALEGKLSIFNAMGGNPDHDFVKDLGRSYAILENRLKPFPCGRLGHAGIEAALAARAVHNLKPEEIEAVRVRVNEHAQYLMGATDPQNGTESMFSIAHGVAAGLWTGRAGPAQFTDAAARDPAIVALRRGVQVIADPEKKSGQATIEIDTKSRGQLTAEVAVQKGFVANPLTDTDVTEKFLDLASPVIGPARARRANDLVLALETVASATEVIELCS